MTKQLRHTAMAVVAVMTFAACGQGGGDPSATTGTVHLTITGRQAMTGVTRVAISVAPAGTSADLTLDQATGAFSGTLALPVGAQVITARAYAGATLVAEGSASVTVSGGQTLSVTIAVLDLTGPEPTPDHAPVLTALSASVSILDVGQTLTLSAAATDIDADPITFSWSAAPAGCASFSPASSVSAGAASTTATALLSGACALSVQASAKALSDTLSTSVEILLQVVIGGLYVPQPTIASVEFLSPATATVLRSDADATVRHPWAAGTPVSIRFSWDDAPWLDRSSASLVDSCGGAVTSTATTASSETFFWTPTGGAVCTLTATVDRQGLTDAFPVAVIVGPPTSCAWTQVAFHSMESAPAGAVVRSGGGGSQGPATVAGRTAWLQGAANWNVLLVPTQLTPGDDFFAIESDVYLPTPPATAANAANLVLFTTTNTAPGPFGTCQWMGGLFGGLVGRPGAASTFEWVDSGGCPQVLAQSIGIASPALQWRHLRIEGQRSTCRMRALVDDVQVDTFDWTGACDLGGGYLGLYGADSAIRNVNVAWSNLSISKGVGACAP